MTAPLALEPAADDRLARLALSRLVEPGSWPLFEAVRQAGAMAVWEALRRGRPVPGLSRGLVAAAAARAAVHEPLEDARRLAACGGRLVVPGDEEWPDDRLDWPDGVLEAAPPLALFVRGAAQLRPPSRGRWRSWARAPPRRTASRSPATSPAGWPTGASRW